MRNVLSVDIEEYFHPTEIQSVLKGVDWNTLPSRVERQTCEILELLDRHGVKGTFFIVGWIARKYPHLVRTIASAGHEIGCHSYMHRLVYDLTPEEFREDTRHCIDAILEACGQRVRSYRAPSYSITKRSFWALEILIELGFTHDSSIYPITHDRYGIPDFPRHAHVIETPSGTIFEVPIAAVKLPGGRTAPVGGGGYLRLLPYRYTAAGLRKINREERQSACVYFHPWEIDPDQPRIAKGLIARMRTYTGIRSMLSKIDRLLCEFEFSTMAAAHPVPAVERLVTF